MFDLGRQRLAADEVDPADLVLVAVERGAAEQHGHHRHQARSDLHAVEVRERAADHQPAVAPPADRAQPTDQRGVHLERVGPLEPRVPEDRRADQHRPDVEGQPEAHRPEERRGLVDELLPDEGEEPQRCRPVAEPRWVRRDAGPRVAPGAPGQQQVDRPHRADRPEDRAEQQGQRHDADPEQHVERAEDRVRHHVGTGDQRPREVAERCQSEQPKRPAQGCAVDEPGEPVRQRTPLRAGVVPGGPPGDDQHGERDHQRGHGSADRERRRDRQVASAAEPVHRDDDHVIAPRAGRSGCR